MSSAESVAIGRTTIGQRLARLPIVPALPASIIAVTCIMAIFSPWLAPYSPIEGNLDNGLLATTWNGGTSAHLLGTDALGRDLLSRLIYGSRSSLSVALVAILVGGGVGIMLGMISGFFKGWADIVIMRITDVGLSMPTILLAIVLAAALGPSFFNVILVIALTLWPKYARLVRGEVLSLREQDFVALARIAGSSTMRIMLRHILPNAVPTIMVLATFQIAQVILLEASLSFLGVGIPPPTPSWGSMVSDGTSYLGSAWWISFFPGATIMLTVLAINLLGDWTRDKFDPRLRQV